MPRTLTQVLATAAFGAVLLAGCSGGSSSANPTDMPNVEPSGAPTTSSGSPTASHSPSSSMTPTTKTTKSATSSNGDAGAPGVPAAARKHTKAGAEAFARHYVDVINQTGMHPETGKLEPLATAGCKSCANHAENVRALVRARQHYSGNIFRISRASVLSRSSGTDTVFADTFQGPIAILNSSGATVESISADKATLVFRVVWTKQGWRVSGIQVADFGTSA